MARGTLIIVMAGLLTAAAVAFIGQRSRFEMNEQENRYGRQVVAREVALSGLQRGISAINLDLMDVDRSFGDRPVSGGTYDIAVSENMYGDLDVTSRATVGDTRHEIQTKVIFESPMTAALVLSGSTVRVDSTGTYLVSGVDSRMTGVTTGPGFLQSAKGIMTDDPANRAAIESHIPHESIQGEGGAPSVSHGVDVTAYEQMYAEAVGRSDKIVLAAPFFGNHGVAGDPAIVHVTGDFVPAGPFTGAGLLIVENGDFVVTDGFRWEGVVLVRKVAPNEIDVRMSGSAAVYGSVAAYEPPPIPGSASCTDVPFSIDGVETRPDVPFQVRVEVLGAAISAGGSYDLPVTARVNTGDTSPTDPWGAYNEALSGNVNRDGSFTYEPGAPLPAGTGVTVSASSWIRTSGDGTQSSDWARHLEQNSNAGGSQLVVLRNGEPVPNIDGYLGQASAADFLGPYIDPVTNTILLDENQSIYLFELGTTNSSSAAYDLQDLVVLTSMLRSDAACSFAGGGTDGINFGMNGDARIHYSGEAVAKLGKKLPSVEQTTRVVVVSQRDVVITPEEAAVANM